MSTQAPLRRTLIVPLTSLAAVGWTVLVSPVDAAPTSSPAVSSSASAHVSTARPRHRVVHKDRIRDVRGAPIDDSLDLSPNRRNKTTDITRVKVTYGRKLVMTTTTRKALPKSQMAVVARIKTSAGGDYDYQISFVRDLLAQPNGLALLTPDFEPVPCRGLRAERKQSKRLVSLLLPGRCIGGPYRVKVAVATLTQKGDRVNIDDAFSRTTDGQQLALSPWIRHR